MKIDNYSFGELTINGQKYTSDLLICKGQIKTNWWRNSGHNLLKDDLTWILNQNPDLLIVGTGKSGVMNVSNKLKEDLGNELDLIIQPTTEAVKKFNQLSQTDLEIAAAFHLTC